VNEVVGFYTKGGKKIPITSRKSMLLKLPPVNNTPRHTMSSRTLQNRLLQQKLQKNPWQNGWKKPLGKTKHYSFNIAKKNGVADYYIEVNKDSKKFLSIPLKPLIQRGISFGLTSITGFPMDVESLEVLIQKATTKYHLDTLMQLA